MRFKALALVFPLALGLLAAPVPVEAQRAGKVYRIGFLATNPRPYFESLWQGLRELGWVEGQNIVVERRYAEGQFERLPALAAELVRLKVDVIVAVATPPTHAAVNATKTIPIVFPFVGDPVSQGFVTSLARPGGNVTGLSFFGPDIVGKQLELLKEAVPNASRVAVLWNPANRFFAPLLLREAKVTGPALGVQLQPLGVRDPNEFGTAFAAMRRERADALLVLADVMFGAHRTRLAELAAKNHLPAMYGVTLYVKAGGLMAYAPNLADLVRRAATYVDKILKGAKPADLPVEQPTKFELWSNLKTAKALGLTIPDSVLFRADRVIK
ncbi:MAG: ABC transporter substrate-binding protein [Anaerolineae bacterium]